MHSHKTLSMAPLIKLTCYQTPQPSPLAVSAVFFTAAENPPKNNWAVGKSACQLRRLIR